VKKQKSLYVNTLDVNVIIVWVLLLLQSAKPSSPPPPKNHPLPPPPAPSNHARARELHVPLCVPESLGRCAMLAEPRRRGAEPQRPGVPSKTQGPSLLTPKTTDGRLRRLSSTPQIKRTRSASKNFCSFTV
jgi:hypothetical protein